MMTLARVVTINMKSSLFIIITFIGLLFHQITEAKAIITTSNLDSLLQTIREPNDKVDAIIKYLEEPENQYLENAVDYANRAYQIAQQTDYASGKLKSMLILGNHYFRVSDYKNAMEYAQKSREMAEDLGFNKELANSLSLIGTIYNELGDYDNSSDYFFKSLKLFEKIKDDDGTSNSLGNIGLVFYSQQDYQKALKYYNNSLVIAKKTDNQPLIKKQYNNIAVVYGDLQQYDTAIVFLRKALEINIKLGDKLGQGNNIMNIGFIQMNEGNYADALISFQQSLDLVTELNNRTHISECNLNFGYCYYSSNRIDESISYFKNALHDAQTQRYYNIINKSSQMLNLIYAQKKDTLNFLKYIILEKNSLDSLYLSQKHELLLKHELQYIYEKMEFEKQLAQKTRNTVMLVIIFSLITGIGILLFIFSRYMLKSKVIVLEKEKIETELNLKNRELTINLISSIKKNEMLTDVSNKLAQLETSVTGKETKDAITRISQELRNSSYDKLFNEFSQRFQEVHIGFYEKLLKTYPDLTQNELKLCALLRLNMSTKDIAEITGQQLTSIDKARYRLRKKLVLSGSDTNLVTFLSQI